MLTVPTILLFLATNPVLQLEGALTQGGLLIGKTTPGNQVLLDEIELPVSKDGTFVFGFGRLAAKHSTLAIIDPAGAVTHHPLEIEAREYDIQRIDGLPEASVTPPEALLARIRADAAMVREARAHISREGQFDAGFMQPAAGPITGVYGSQRILNGKPRQPHFGIDYAAETGAPVKAPAAGTVRLAADLYYSGNTIIIDHGHGLSSSFLHLSEMHVNEGQQVDKGEKIGSVGATGRATGPHLDWRMNWRDRRIDPALVLDYFEG